MLHLQISIFPQRLGQVVEERKAFTVATNEENKPKNRYDFVLPYDSNRVILAPMSAKPNSTYINASFVAVSLCIILTLDVFYLKFLRSFNIFRF